MIELIPRAEWDTNPPIGKHAERGGRPLAPNRRLATIKGVEAHHQAGPLAQTGAACARAILTFHTRPVEYDEQGRDLWVGKGWQDIWYHVGVDPRDGLAYELRPMRHTPNKRTVKDRLLVCVFGDGEPLSVAAKITLRAIIEETGGVPNLTMHCERDKTECPGPEVKAFVAELRHLRAYGWQPPVQQPQPSQPSEADRNIARMAWESGVADSLVALQKRVEALDRLQPAAGDLRADIIAQVRAETGQLRSDMRTRLDSAFTRIGLLEDGPAASTTTAAATAVNVPGSVLLPEWRIAVAPGWLTVHWDDPPGDEPEEWRVHWRESGSDAAPTVSYDGRPNGETRRRRVPLAGGVYDVRLVARSSTRELCSAWLRSVDVPPPAPMPGAME